MMVETGATNFYNFLETKFQSQREQKEYYTDIRPSLYISRIHHRGSIWHMRTGQKACHHIPQHQRLFQFLEQ